MNLPVGLQTLNPKVGTPLYVQLKEALLSLLHGGDWPEGQPLPSERELSEGLRVSRSTVRQAIHELELEGWLSRQQGRGTFLVQTKVEQPLEMITSFSENMKQAGIKAESKLISAALEPAPPRIAKALGIRPNSVAAVITRLRIADGLPLMVERSHLNYTLVPGILEKNLEGSLYELLHSAYRLQFAQGVESLEALTAEPWLAKLLGIKRGSPVLYTERTVYTDTGVTLEFTQRYGRADKCSFRVTLHGDNTQITVKEAGGGRSEAEGTRIRREAGG